MRHGVISVLIMMRIPQPKSGISYIIDIFVLCRLQSFDTG